jgi:hypothetical protein
MRALISCLLVMSMTVVAAAQGYPQPQPQPYPQQPYPYGYQQQPMMPVQLTLDERYLLERGFISDGEWIGGGFANIFFGFGIGQAIQGRWSERGWIFTLGQGAFSVAFMYGFIRWFGDCFESNCNNDDRAFELMLVGGLGAAVFYTWGAIDAFAVPPEHNRRVRDLRMRLGMPVPAYATVSPYLTAPKGDTSGAVGGVTFRF